MVRPVVISAMMALAMVATPALAGQVLGNGGIAPVPMPKRIMPDEERTSPHPMTYGEEVARGLGIRDGKMDLFEVQPARNSLMPTLSGSLGGQGAMLKLKWRP